MEETRLVADVALDARVAGADALYTYQAPDGARPGQAWFVPIGPRRTLGWIAAVREADEAALGFPFSRLRPLIQKVDGLELPARTVDLIAEVARQCLSPVSSVMTLASPPGILDRLVTIYRHERDPEPGESLSAAQDEALAVLRQGHLTETKSRPLPPGSRSALRALSVKGLASTTLGLNPLSDRRTASAAYRLTSDEAKVEKFLTKEGRRRPAQAMTVMRMQGSAGASFSVQEIKLLAGVTEQTVKALVQAGLLEPAEAAHAPGRPSPVPNPDQAAAIAAVSKAVAAQSAEGFLLYGVTGSGKTEVYLQAAAEALKWGRQVLFLVPEIALTAQVIAQLRERFGRSVAVLHSGLSPGERLENWMRVQTGEAPLVLGPRSALFAPLANLGLIVMDEEHEASYKQENTPRYQSRLVARALARLHRCPLIQGSATPSLETMWEAEQGILQLLRLPKRAAAARLPKVHIEDLTEGYKSGRPSLFSEPLVKALGETLDQGHQAILFLNRRAYAQFLLCRECGHRWGCPSCAVTLSYHQKEAVLRCHHCDYSCPAPDSCPQCGGVKIKPFGIGSERVEEEVKNLFPKARVARLDRDIARRKGALEEAFALFRGLELDVLVGTQMVAKGLDFPNVALVGVIAADISLNIPDFRASERTFQLLSQVAGRAGRGAIEGRVIVQTLSPDHPSVVAAADHDYDRLYRELIEERGQVGYPPFVRLVNILVTGQDREAVVGLSKIAGIRLSRALPQAAILGPVDCPLEKIQGLWRRHVLVKLDSGADLEPLREALHGLEDPKARIAIDVDPSSLT